MPVPTNQEMVDALRTAIHAIVVDGVASYSVFGRMVTLHNLQTITATLKEFEQKLADELLDSSGGRTLVTFGERP